MDVIELKPSRWLGVLLLAMALLAGAAVALANLPAPLQWALLAVIVLAVGFALARQRGPMPQLGIDGAGRLWVRDPGHEWQEAGVAGGSFVSPLLCVLELAPKRRPLILLPDSAGAEAWRRLRVSLRWGPHKRLDTPGRGAD